MKRGELIWRVVSIAFFVATGVIALLILYQLLQNFG
jgi:hypothetical protein